MSCVAKHHRKAVVERVSLDGRTPVDVWLRRQMKVAFDNSLREDVPREWVDLVEQADVGLGPTTWREP